MSLTTLTHTARGWKGAEVERKNDELFVSVGQKTVLILQKKDGKYQVTSNVSDATTEHEDDIKVIAHVRRLLF